MIDLLLRTSWWVYLVFFYCIIIGWKALHPRVISYYRLFVVPLLIIFWWLHTTFLRYDLSFSHIFASITAASAGGLAGWQIYRQVPVEADRRKRLIKLPKTKSTLVSIVLIFFFRYYFGYYHILDPASLINPFFIYSDLIISALIVGFITGRTIYYLNAYRKAPNTDLCK